MSAAGNRALLAAGNLSVGQFLGFAVVGALGTLVHYAILFVTVSVFGRDPVLGTVLGASAGAITNFLLNHRLTFRSDKGLGETAPRFFAVAALGLAVNALVMYILSTRLSLHYLLAQVVATGLVLVLNYILNAIWTFGTRHADP